MNNGNENSNNKDDVDYDMMRKMILSLDVSFYPVIKLFVFRNPKRSSLA